VTRKGEAQPAGSKGGHGTADGSGGELTGRVALVTGAAGDGIGQATAWRLAEAGAAVAVTDVHERRTEEVSAALAERFGDRVAGFSLDVGDLDACRRVVGEVEESLGAVDVLVNNAAVNVLAPVSRYSTEAWDEVLRTDLTGCFELIRSTLPGMMQRGWGSIVNVTSVAAFIGNAREGPYAAAKAALHSLTRSVAVEGGPHGVRCNAVAPGIVWSRFVRKYEETLAGEVARTPLRRIGEPGEVAEAILFLASDRSSFMTGEVLNVSGGWYMRP
jgi:3-oxoacyl-[acyl-carrier protein] reductase